MRTIYFITLFILIQIMTTQAQHGTSAALGTAEMFFSKKISGTMDEVYQKVSDALKEEKFGIITEIDMAGTLKEKLDVDMPPYKILGVCNPGFAWEAIRAEPNIGVFLPCKVILKQLDQNTIEVVSVNPEALMNMLGNNNLDQTAEAVGRKLEKVINGL